MFSEDKLLYYGYAGVILYLAYLTISSVYIYLILLLVFSVLYSRLKKKYSKSISVEKRGVLITGCDTGFGHQLALKLTDRGFTVFAGCLLPSGGGAKALKAKNKKNLHVLELNVTQDSSVKETVNAVEKLLPSTGLWAVVNNAAINRLADIEFSSIEMMKEVAEVNYYGLVRVTKAFLPMLRKSRGRVINVTSVKGRLSLPSDSIYTATKWAGEAFSDCLRREMRRFGVKVVIVEPGNFGGLTGMLNEENIKRVEGACNKSWENASEEVKLAYGRQCIDEHIKGLHSSGSTSAPTIDPVIEAMEDAVVNESPQYRYLVHGGKKFLDWYCVCAVMHELLPEWIVDTFIEYTSPPPKAAKQIN